MEKMLERIESRQQKADSETKSVYTTMADLWLVVLMAGLTTQSPGAECHPGSQMVLELHWLH
jgi:hypothetical protein